MQSKNRVRPNHLAFKIEYPERAYELRTEAFVAQPSMLNKNKNNEDWMPIVALWDTGATVSAISSNVVSKLGLFPVDKAENYTAAGLQIVDLYYIDIALPNKVIVSNLRVTECILPDFDVLIGMDIITAGDFAIANAKGMTRFSFCMPPHDNPICLYEKSQKVNKR